MSQDPVAQPLFEMPSFSSAQDTAVSYSRHINFSTPLQGPRTKIQSIPAIVAIGLQSFFVTLRSLVKGRHELLGEVCRAVCTTLEGACATCTFFLAHFFLTLIRGWVANVLNSVLMSARNQGFNLDAKSLVQVLSAANPRQPLISTTNLAAAENATTADAPQLRRFFPGASSSAAFRPGIVTII